MPLSLFDRLSDSEALDLPPNSREYERKLKASIRRDLTALLNTRRAEADFDPSFEHSTKSLLTYGIVDFTAMNLTSNLDQEKLRYSVERAVRQFEPRLSHVRVLLETADINAPLVHLTIEATLQFGTRREDVTFPVALHRDSRRITMRGEAK